MFLQTINRNQESKPDIEFYSSKHIWTIKRKQREICENTYVSKKMKHDYVNIGH